MPDSSQSALDASQGGRFFGKYRGTVVNNFDSNARGRLQVTVPEVLGSSTPVWALPCVPYAGPGVGFHTMPPIGANVWVEFEAGNLRHPIWAGCFWVDGDIPAVDANPDVLFLRTAKAVIRVDDSIGEVLIESGSAKITITSSEVKIEAPTVTQDTKTGGKTTLTAAGFDAQDGALKVI
ncbi:MAG: phage baseplate assembly protein V [Roseobacter sp.]